MLFALIADSRRRALSRAIGTLLFSFTTAMTAGATAAAPPVPGSAANANPAAGPTGDLAQRWGIEVTGVYLSAGGNLVDFRYRILDPAKAAVLTRAESKPQLEDQTSGAKLLVPNPDGKGQLRQTVKEPVAGKIYFMLFANTRHGVKSGDLVNITVGECKLEGLRVQ
jgi:hypothetical protein